MAEKRFMPVATTARELNFPLHQLRTLVRQQRVPGLYMGHIFYIDVPAFRKALDEACKPKYPLNYEDYADMANAELRAKMRCRK